MFEELRHLGDGGFLSEDERGEAGAEEVPEVGEEEQPGEAVLPAVRQTLHRRETISLQRTNWTGGGTGGRRQH